MTQDTILVSPNTSACLKPGSLCRSFRISTFALRTSPGLSPAKRGDTPIGARLCESQPSPFPTTPPIQILKKPIVTTPPPPPHHHQENLHPTTPTTKPTPLQPHALLAH